MNVKQPGEHRRRIDITLSPMILVKLAEATSLTGKPISRIVEAALAPYLDRGLRKWRKREISPQDRTYPLPVQKA